MPRLLLDANLSWRSVSVLKQHFSDCFHVDDIGLKVPAKDGEIWQYAKTNDLVIITNDEDFLGLLVTLGFPPKVVWFAIGNQTRKQRENLLISLKNEIIDFYKSNEYGLLEINIPETK
jgi:predicted nuclease of predicted toxin-antitoxin system